MPNIIADENIPDVERLFSPLGNIHCLPGRAITNEEIKKADILLVRSVTPVNKALLEGSNIRFVASATAGIDHVDRNWLKRAGIGFAHAPGSNAVSVVEYVLAAIMETSQRKKKDWRENHVGIIGRGEVGRRLHERLNSLGMKCMVFDPHAPANDGSDTPLTYLLQNADIISLHTPLITDGPFPTWHLINGETLKTMKPDATVINTSRGSVVHNAALLEHLSGQSDFLAVLDVWENEPTPNLELVDRALIATGHIAGYGMEGKLRGAWQIYKAVCDFLSLPATSYAPELPVCRIPLEISLKISRLPEQMQVRQLIKTVYDIQKDSALFKKRMLSSSKQELAHQFDQYRKQYPNRREFTSVQIKSPENDVRIRFSPTAQQAGFDTQSIDIGRE